MAKTIWNAAERQELVNRMDLLKAGIQPLWGRMAPAQMARHCDLAMQAALGELKVAPKNSPLRYWPFSRLVIYVLPWPKGAPTAPELLPPAAGDLDEHIKALKATLERLASRGEAQPLQPHAAFGRLSGKDWGALTYRHIDHHLRQFGV